MEKINSNKFNVGFEKNDTSKNNDVLGSLFSIPIIADENKINGKKNDELLVNPSIEKVLNSKNSLNTLGKLEIMYKDFFSGMSKKQLNSTVFKNDQAFDFNSRDIPNILSLVLKRDKSSKINHIKINGESKFSKSDFTKAFDLSIDESNQDKIGILKSSDKVLNKDNLGTASYSKLVKKNNLDKNIINKENLNDIFSKIEKLKEDISSNNFDNKVIFYENEIIYKKLKSSNENSSISINSDQINKIENLNLRNNSGQQQFNSGKNMNFILDQMIDELDMSKLGWTEKLILRIEKGLNEDEKQIELALKPKELGNLKINLKIKDKNAHIIMKVENAASMIALQSNEVQLTKVFSDQGFILEKINFENSLMNSNKDNKNSADNYKHNNSEKDKLTNLEDKENNKDDNLNYLININA